MIIKATSKLTGVTHIREIPITKEDLVRVEENDECIQIIAPYLSSDDREFLITGITPEEWKEVFWEEEEE